MSFLVKNKVEQLEQKSANILDIFTKTVNDLNKVNAQAEKEASNRRAEAEQLLSEAKSLDAVVEKNSRVVSKINSILKD